MMIAARNAFLMSGTKLPYDAEVEYLESTGTQYIDTGVAISSALDFDAVFARTAASGAANAYFWGVDGTWGVDAVLCYVANGSPYPVNMRSGTSQQSFGTPALLAPFAMHSAGGRVTINNMTRTLNAWPTNQNTVNVFYNGQSRCYSFSISSAAGLLVRDLIPVRVGSGASAVGYLYDRANPTGGPLGNGLYGNAADGQGGVTGFAQFGADK